MYSVGIDDITKNTSITDGKVIGEGIFDKLMETATLHLKAQFDEGRIRGEDFAQAYMAVYTANLNTALNLALSRHINELQASNLEKDIELKNKEMELRDKEIAQKDYELQNILPAQRDSILADIEVRNAQEDKLVYEVTHVLPKEVEKLEEEIDLLQTQDSEAVLNGVSDRAIKSSQKLLVDAQTITEGAKKLLIDRQKQGFDDTHLLDLLKQMTDSFSVLFSVAVDSDKLVLPDIISKGDGIDTLGKGIASKLGITLPEYVPPTP